MLSILSSRLIKFEVGKVNVCSTVKKSIMNEKIFVQIEHSLQRVFITRKLIQELSKFYNCLRYKSCLHRRPPMSQQKGQIRRPTKRTMQADSRENWVSVVGPKGSEVPASQTQEQKQLASEDPSRGITRSFVSDQTLTQLSQ